MLLEYVSFPHSINPCGLFQAQRSLACSRVAFPTLNRQSCENFAQLAKRGYYNGVIFHRIIAVRHDESGHIRLIHLLYVLSLSKDFMVQGGDPTGTGKGGTSIYGQKLYVTHTSSVLCYIVQLTQITPFHLFIPLAAKTRFIQNYGSQVPESSQWPTRDQTPTVRSLLPPSLPDPDLLARYPPLPLSDPPLHETLMIVAHARFLLS